jgi:hypothetical protein
MNQADLATFNQALSLAQRGQKVAAYNQFTQLLMVNNNQNDIDLLVQIIYTTPNSEEAERLLRTAQRLAPNDPPVVSAGQWWAQEKQRKANESRPIPPSAYESQPPYPVDQSQTQPFIYQQPQPQYQQPQYQQPQYQYQQPPAQIYAPSYVMPVPAVVHCMNCGSNMQPLVRQRVSPLGLILCILSALTCVGLVWCWAFLLLKEDYRACAVCGRGL